MSLANRIKSRRDILHMSQKQLATQLGYQPECGTIYKLETGKTKLPVDKLCKLAEVLETTPNWLLGWGGALKFQRFQKVRQKAEVMLCLHV